MNDLTLKWSFTHQTLEFWIQILKSFNIFGFKSNFHYLCNQKQIKYQYDKAYFRKSNSIFARKRQSQLVGLDSKTVERYIDILEKSFLIFRLSSFSRNLRNELKSSRKIYFWDLGIRNLLIGNLSQIENRADAGPLWENFVIAERLKRNSYNGSIANSWFWRTQQQKEIDYLEEEDGQLKAYEFKWNDKKASVRTPGSFAKAYPEATFHVITPKNADEFLVFPPRDSPHLSDGRNLH